MKAALPSCHLCAGALLAYASGGFLNVYTASHRDLVLLLFYIRAIFPCCLTSTACGRWLRSEWKSIARSVEKTVGASAVKDLLRWAGYYMRKKDIVKYAEVGGLACD